MVTAPQRILRAFGPLLDIDEVLQIEPGRYLTFEYIGPTDFFHEAPTGRRVRGAHCTSVEAAFRTPLSARHLRIGPSGHP